MNLNKEGADMKFDFKKRGRTLREVGRDEKEAALPKVIGFVVNKLAGKTKSGAFAASLFGRKTPVEYFTEVAYGVVFDRRKLDDPNAWRDDQLLTDLLKGAAWSAMGHWERWWERLQKRLGHVISESELPEPEDFAAKLAVSSDEDDMDDEERAVADAKADERRRIGFETVEELVKDDPILKKYVKAVKELYTERAIRKRMNMTKEKLAETEAKVLELIEQYWEREKQKTIYHLKFVEMK
jgi:hypothetical protein